jgi:hypothetical protein
LKVLSHFAMMSQNREAAAMWAAANPGQFVEALAVGAASTFR